MILCVRTYPAVYIVHGVVQNDSKHRDIYFIYELCAKYTYMYIITYQ